MNKLCRWLTFQSWKMCIWSLFLPRTSSWKNTVIHDHAMVHPLTQTVGRYVVGDRFHDGPKTSGYKQDTCSFHNMKWCPELLNFQSVTSEVINSRIITTRLKSSYQQNLMHYTFYNRLMNHWHNISIVSKQLQHMQAKAKNGEVIVRDKLHRFVYVCSNCKKGGHTKFSCSAEPQPMEHWAIYCLTHAAIWPAVYCIKLYYILHYHIIKL